MKTLRYIITLLSAACMLGSCIYPFTPDIRTAEAKLVIEGDILIGEMTEIKVSYLRSLDNTYGEEHIDCPTADAWVESEDGTVYKADSSFVKEGRFVVNLKNAPDNCRYRLRVSDKDNNKEYASFWAEPLKPAQIDSLSYIPEPDRNRMAIALSMHSPHGNSYFRWTYHEYWEYHAYYRESLYYAPPVRGTETWNDGKGVCLPDAVRGFNTYTCWSNMKSKEIMIFSTDKQTDDRFVDLEFHLIERNSKKLSDTYYIEVTLAALTEDGYQYWNNVQANSEYQGGIFAPNPSEMVGNIRCLQDTTEMVIGYINVARTSKAHLFIFDEYTKFYEADRFIPDEEEVIKEEDWRSAYYNGKLPVEYGDPGMTKVMWSTEKCVDCRYYGGTVNRPDFWEDPIVQ